MDTKKKPPIKKIIIIAVVILVFICILGAIFSGGNPKTSAPTNVADRSENLETTSSPVVNNTEVPVNTNTPMPTNEPTATPNPNLLKPGTYLVNDEIKPGLYKGSGNCYWERLKDLSGSFDGIIANGNTNGQFYVEVKDSDKAFSIDCEAELLEPLPEPAKEFPTTFKPGQYLVGRDISAGIHRGEGSCYWERQKDAAGGFDAIIANGNTDGQFYVEVKNGDFALSTNCDVIALESIPQPKGELPQSLDPGVYLVGRDILPGTYRGEGSCYWERLRDVAGGFTSIIANGNSDGQFYVQVSQTDFAFATNCAVDRTGD